MQHSHSIYISWLLIASSRSTRGILDNHSQPGDARKWDSAVLQALWQEPVAAHGEDTIATWSGRYQCVSGTSEEDRNVHWFAGMNCVFIRNQLGCSYRDESYWELTCEWLFWSPVWLAYNMWHIQASRSRHVSTWLKSSRYAPKDVPVSSIIVYTQLTEKKYRMAKPPTLQENEDLLLRLDTVEPVT